MTEEKPVRVQLSRAKGWRMPPNTVKVDRSTRWGNPFLVERQSGHIWDQEARRWRVTYTVRRLEGAYFYRTCLPSRDVAAALAVEHFTREIVTAFDLEGLRGKNLACWCALEDPCHADVLLEMANRDSDGSGEAGETGTGSTEGDSAVPERQSP